MMQTEIINEQLDFFDPLKVFLSNFEGPLELLLELIRKHKMDIQELSLADICEPYLKYLDQMKELNLDIAGQFFDIAATLILIKSKSLLPKVEEVEDEEEIDPEEALIARLMEYKKYKESAKYFENCERLGRDFFTHPEAESTISNVAPKLEQLSIYNLLKAYQSVLKQQEFKKPHEIRTDDNPIEMKILNLMNLLKSNDSFLFHSHLSKKFNRSELVISFMAILELAKMKLIKINQLVEFGTIQCKAQKDIEGEIKNYEHLFREQGLFLSA